MNEHTPKQFVLQLGSLASLYLTIIFLLLLAFSLINIQFPDPSESFYSLGNHADSVRVSIAALLVFFPAYLFLTRTVNKTRRVQAGSYTALTKWLIYLSLFVAGSTILIDLAVLIYGFLEGDLPVRFALKILAVLVVIIPAFFYYLKDSQGYWLKKEKLSIYFGVFSALVVLTGILFGLQYIETPAEVREGRLDEKQVEDLQTIQWQIEDYLYVNGVLPETLGELENVPSAPENRAAYAYSITDSGFSLCATFVTEQQDSASFAKPLRDQRAVIVNAYDWQYEKGEYCFERIVNFSNLENQS
mgnify:CR=1 FL=1